MPLRCSVLPLSIVCCLLLSNIALAGTGYIISSDEGDEKVTYRVKFGGGKLNEQWTAFDVASKKFVYLRFPRNGEQPKPVAHHWNPSTGDTAPLYKFPEVDLPLPLIPNVEALKVVPFAKEKGIKVETELFFD